MCQLDRPLLPRKPVVVILDERGMGEMSVIDVGTLPGSTTVQYNEVHVVVFRLSQLGPLVIV